MRCTRKLPWQAGRECKSNLNDFKLLLWDSAYPNYSCHAQRLQHSPVVIEGEATPRHFLSRPAMGPWAHLLSWVPT